MNVSTPARRRPRYDRDASRTAIVEAAMRRFAAQGFAGTRVEDIVEAAGYTRGAFYFHFENKLDCFWAVVDHRERMRGDWADAATEGLDATTASLTDVLARTFARFAESERGVTDWVLVMVDFFQQHRNEPELADKLAPIYAVWQDNIRRFVAGLQRGGWVDPRADAALLATQVFAYVEGLSVHARLYGLTPDEQGRALYDGLLRLLSSSST
jgi:AcrR family transcriptional regulator